MCETTVAKGAPTQKGVPLTDGQLFARAQSALARATERLERAEQNAVHVYANGVREGRNQAHRELVEMLKSALRVGHSDGVGTSVQAGRRYVLSSLVAIVQNKISSEGAAK